MHPVHSQICPDSWAGEIIESVMLSVAYNGHFIQNFVHFREENLLSEVTREGVCVQQLSRSGTYRIALQRTSM